MSIYSWDLYSVVPANRSKMACAKFVVGEGQENYQTVIVGMRDRHAARCNCRIRPTRSMGTFLYIIGHGNVSSLPDAMLRWRVSFR